MTISGDAIGEVESCKYLGSLAQNDGVDVKRRIKCGWVNCREALCVFI